MKREYIFVDDREGNAVAGAEVYIKSGGSTITIYSDNGVTTQTNPMSTDNDGKCNFFAADGTYTIEIYVEGVLQQTVSGYQHYDETDPEIAAIRSMTSAADKLPLFTGSGTGTTITCSSFIQTLLDDADAATARATLGVSAGTGDLVSTNNLSDVADAVTSGENIKPPEFFAVACSDESTALSAGTSKIKFPMPYAVTLTGVRAFLNTAQTSGNIFTVDINEGGTSILSTKLTIDNGETSSVNAATAAVISDTALADDAVITVDIDQIGDGTAAGLKIMLLFHRA